MANETDKQIQGSPWSGALIGFFSSLCCLLPLVAIVLGFGSLPWLLKLTTYRPYFIALSLVLLLLLLSYTYQRNLSCCTTAQKKRQLYTTLTLIALAYVTVFSFTSLALPALLKKYNQTPTPLSKSQIKPTNPSQLKRVNFVVANLTCPTCPNLIRSILLEQKGVKDAQVLYPSGVGYANYDPKLISAAKIANTLKNNGYEIKIRQ